MERLVNESFLGRPLHFVIHSAYSPKRPKTINGHNVTLSSFLDKIYNEIKHTVHISSSAQEIHMLKQLAKLWFSDFFLRRIFLIAKLTLSWIIFMCCGTVGRTSRTWQQFCCIHGFGPLQIWITVFFKLELHSVYCLEKAFL